MSYPLRLPSELDAEARDRCKRLGISLNALIAVALDEYLHRAPDKAPAPVVAAAKVARRVEAKPAEQAEPEPDDKWAWLWASEPPKGKHRWKWFNAPDMWPVIDPDPEWQAYCAEHGLSDSDEHGFGLAAMDREYWRTRERPPERRS